MVLCDLELTWLLGPWLGLMCCKFYSPRDWPTAGGECAEPLGDLWQQKYGMQSLELQDTVTENLVAWELINCQLMAPLDRRFPLGLGFG